MLLVLCLVLFSIQAVCCVILALHGTTGEGRIIGQTEPPILQVTVILIVLLFASAQTIASIKGAFGWAW